MATIVGLDDLSKALIDVGNNLVNPHSSSIDDLLTLLDKTESLLRKVEQDQPMSMQTALIPTKEALVSVDLLTHPDSNVRVSVVSCLTEIIRITAPEAPYTDDQMKAIFRLTIESFEKLAHTSSRTYSKAESVLDNVSKVKSCLMMLDLQCDDLILQMFRNFLKIIRSDHPRVVLSSMEMIMITIIDETEVISKDLLDILLTSLQKGNQNVSPMAWSLMEKVVSRCACKLKPYIIDSLNSTRTSLDMYSPVVNAVCQTVFETIKIVPTKVSGEKLDLGNTESKSKKPLRDENRRSKLRNGSREAEEIELVNTTGRRGRKPNSLMNPDEGYDMSWISEERESLKKSLNNKLQKKKGKVSAAAKRTPSSLSTSRALSGSFKRSRVAKMDEIDDHDSDSPLSPRTKRLTSCFRDEEIIIEEESEDERGNRNSNKKIIRSQNRLERSERTTKKKKKKAKSGIRSEDEEPVQRYEISEDDRGNANSNKKIIRSQNRFQRSERTVKKKETKKKRAIAEDEYEEPVERYEVSEDDRGNANSNKKIRSQRTAKKKEKEKKIVVEAKRGIRSSARSEAKRKREEGASSLEDTTPVAHSSKRKKMISPPKSQPTTRRQSSRKVESDKSGFGDELVGKRVNIWWPLDKTFYEGIVKSYSSRKKMHRVVYLDGDSEELNLIKERWELLDDYDFYTSDSEQDKEIDLPESIPLFDIIQKQKVKKVATTSVERSSKLNKKVKRGKGALEADDGDDVSEESEKTRQGKNLKEVNDETDISEEDEEVSQGVDQENEDVEVDSEKQEESDDGSEEESIEAETKEKEEKCYETFEVESEREEEDEEEERGSDSEEEPKWRETEDEAEDREDDDKETSTRSAEFTKEEDDDDEEEEEDEEKEK